MAVRAWLDEWQFGDGSDGDVTISAGTTTLTRSMFYNNLTLNGGNLNTGLFRVFCLNTIYAISGSFISVDGGAGTAASGASSGNNGAVTTGEAGANGAGTKGVTGANGAGGNNSAISIFAIGTASGGVGGKGGAGTNPGGSNSGTIDSTGSKPLNPDPHVLFGTLIAAGGVGGQGGSSGGGSGVAAGGGGGGGGAGGSVIYLCAKAVNGTGGTLSFQSNGGDGGSGGAGAGANCGGGGGGGGGAGGTAILVYRYLAAPTIDLSLKGGTGGAGGAAGAGGVAGSAGSDGGSGTLLLYQV